MLLSLLRSTLGPFSASSLVRRTHWHLKSFILIWKSLHVALHTEVHSRLIFCEFAWYVAPIDHWNLLFSHGNLYILFSILRSTLGSFSVSSLGTSRLLTIGIFHFQCKCYILLSILRSALGSFSASSLGTSHLLTIGIFHFPIKILTCCSPY